MSRAADGHTETYDQAFWERRDVVASRSANACVPFLVEMLSPVSVVDVGCGRGHWIAAFAQWGVTDVLGIDGPGVLHNSSLLFPSDRFLERDLTQPIHVPRRFDLAVCLEVAEHLPRSSARTLVTSLASLSSTVLFSAAVPGQGGVGHINESWPWYWKDLFAELGFNLYDPFRHRLWHHPDVAPWYKQNMLVYADIGPDAAAHSVLAPYQSLELTLIAVDTLYRLSRPSLARRAYSRLKRLVRRD